MVEMYWLTRLDAIEIAGAFIFVIGLVGVLLRQASRFEGFLDEEECIISKTANRIFVILLLVGTLIVIFVPSKKDALLILGIGGSIDYIESNETMKQLPDKCVKALGKFADEYLLDDEE